MSAFPSIHPGGSERQFPNGVYSPNPSNGKPKPQVRLALACSFQWLILCAHDQKPQEGRGFSQR